MKAQKKVLTDKVYKLTKSEAPLSFLIPTRHSAQFPLLYFDEESGTNRALRYARNQKTPFEDEQDGNAILEPVTFEDGFLSVPRTNPVLQQFLYYHPLNGVKFIEVNEEKDASVEVDKLNIEVDALIEARQLSVDQLEMVSRVLFNRDVTKMSTAELKRDILVFAKNDPRTFLSAVNDPALKFQSTVSLIFEKGFLTFRKSNKEVWFNIDSNKTKMLNIPYGENPMDIVVSYLQSDSGLDTYKILEKLL
jgi:hypothetical protein